MRNFQYTQPGTSFSPDIGVIIKQNQDFSLSGNFPLWGTADAQGYFLALSDGLGSKDLSHVGAECICQSFFQLISSDEGQNLLAKEEIHDFLRNLHGIWLENLEKNPIPDCACTGIFAAVLHDYVYLFRLGDGFLCAVWENQIQVLWEDKEKKELYLNETTSLAEKFQLSDWEFAVFPQENLLGLVAGSDGIEIGWQQLADYKNFSEDFISSLFFQNEEDIFQSLKNVVEEQENRDDKTLVLLLEEISLRRKKMQNSTAVYDAFSYLHHCLSPISRGGQGEVYRSTQTNIAIKFQFDAQGNRDMLHLEKNKNFQRVRCLAIPEYCHVTLPLAPLKDYVGYVMVLLEDMDSFSSCFDLNTQEYGGGNPFFDQILAQGGDFAMIQLFHNYILSGGKRRRLLAYYKLAMIFTTLHSRGLVFGDFSPSNVFFSKDQHFSHVWLIDVDNLDYAGNHLKKRPFFTPRFVAPEVARGEKACSMYSDDYSFALALFYQLTGTHPFEGKESEQFDQETVVDFKENPALDQGQLPWILDPEDRQNQLSHTAIPHEYLCSKALLSCFHRSFSKKGRENFLHRCSSLEWMDMLAKELDSSLVCPFCQMDFTWSQEEAEQICPWCDEKVPYISVSAYTYPQNRLIWRFVQEQKENISLPLRLFRGNQVLSKERKDLMDEILGEIQKQEGVFILLQRQSQFLLRKMEAEGQFSRSFHRFALSQETQSFLWEDTGNLEKFRVEVRFL